MWRRRVSLAVLAPHAVRMTPGLPLHPALSLGLGARPLHHLSFALQWLVAGTVELSKEADAAFTQLKQYLTSPPVLTAPREDETLLLYIVATNRVVSTAMVVKRDEPGHVYKVQ